MALLQRCLCLTSIMLLSAAPVLAGAWPQAAGTVEVIAGASYSQSDSGLDGRMAGGNDSKFRKLEVSPLVSWGIDGANTLYIQPSWQALKADNARGGSDNGAGLADAEFAWRRTLWRGDTNIVAIQPLIRVPTGYKAADAPPRGSGKVDGEMRVMYGHGFDGGFFDGQIGWRTRGGPAADEVRLDLTAGWRPDADWLLLAQSFNAVSGGGPGPGYGDVRRYKLQLSAVRRLTDRVGVQAGLSRAIGGRNAGGERTALVALWWQFGT